MKKLKLNSFVDLYSYFLREMQIKPEIFYNKISVG